MIQVKIMTNFSFPQTRNFVPNWFLMRLEREEVIKKLLPILCSYCVKLLKNQLVYNE